MNLNKEFKNIKITLATVFSKPSYFLTAIISGLALIILTNFVVNYKLIVITLLSDVAIGAKGSLLIGLLHGIITSNSAVSLITLIVTGILFGINVSLIVFKIRIRQSTQKNESLLVSIGTVAGIVASGCTSCSVSILALLGVAGGAAALPFMGLELWIPSVVLLTISIFLSRSIANCETCQL